MTDYIAPLRDMKFVLNEVIDIQNHYQTLGLEDINNELVDAVLDEGARFTQGVFAGLNRSGDEEGVSFNRGIVTTPKGFKEAYQQYCKNGWASIVSPEAFGGQNLPSSLATPFHEMTLSANLSLRSYSGLTEGAALAIEKHGNEELKATYLEKLVSGIWSGTMCLTESQAGTDLGMLQTKAKPNNDGSFAITGTKIFITGGEHDLTENIVHLVLATLPDSPKGSRGISLFLAPKYLPDNQGNIGQRNTVECGAVEHKMGIKASATCVLNFDGAKAWLIGEEHNGLACMFTMMNDARFQVGLQGLGIAEMAFQGGLEYAKDRIQTRSLSGVKNPEKAADPIIVHPDVRRMLFTQKSLTEGCRMMAYYVATLLDIERFETDPTKLKENAALLAFFIPIVKSFLTDTSQEVSSLGVQIYGGHGFIREWGMEQLMRDSRILMIYEGTNGIQALDFIRRKMLGDKGATFTKVKDEIMQFCLQKQNSDSCSSLLTQLINLLPQWEDLATSISQMSAQDPEEIGAVSVDFLQYSSYVCLAYFWAKMAITAQNKIDLDESEADFYKSKIATAVFYFDRILPRAQSHRSALLSGADNLMLLDAEHFSF
jgi:alkylation response protein AidB-like acyl-CoA dehydrogenase